ncbi:polyprenyl synthetase family protein [soil metagenome]
MRSAFSSVLDAPATAQLDALMRDAVADIRQSSVFLADMTSYHMGWLDNDLRQLAPGRVDQGKRIRPTLALLSCLTCSSSVERAFPLAAAIELLHNFTLVHDDIQDQSRTRRHRPTVWSIWGIAQAINVGDALFAASHRVLLRSTSFGVDHETVVALATRFDRMTIDIVGGQVIDLQFESGAPVSQDDYLAMIARKTAAILDYGAWSGAIVGGASPEVAASFARLGKAIGLGFQLRDDMLGVWGTGAQTGKPEADDIRRKKQSLPVVLLRQVADSAELKILATLYAKNEIDDDGVRQVLALLDRHLIRNKAQAMVETQHRYAELVLGRLGDHCDARGIAGLSNLVEALSTRQH